MSYKITERSLYKPISKILEQYHIRSIHEVIIEGGKEPDLLAEINGQKFIIEVKINREAKLLEDVPRAWNKAKKLNAQGFVSILFPSYIREISPDILDSVAPSLEITTTILALPWIADCWKKINLESFARKLWEAYEVYLETKYPSVNYDVIVNAAREAVAEIASIIKRNLVSRYIDDAMAIVGRFDIYRATLRDFGAREEEMKAWIADIAAYLVTNQLLFYHILSQKVMKYKPLPEVDPLMPDTDLIDKLREMFSDALKDYEPIFGPDLLSIIKRAGGVNALYALSRYITTLKALKPEHIKSELFGRLYQESIPPETRKNLGAFFTKPKAAALLAMLAIDKWDEKILDPACGSGTLLTEAYRAKKMLAPPNLSEKELHEKLLSDIYGIDIMHFAYHMTSINLLAQNPTIPAELENIKAGDGLEPMLFATRSSEDDPPAMQLVEWMEEVKPEKLPYESFDVVIMNPPFTRRERLSEVGETSRLEKIFHEAFDGEVVRGKVGYWAYFVAAADNVIKPNGKLAMVTPEEFFAGGSAESLRRFMFLGEAFKKGKYFPIKDSSKIYSIKYVIRSAKEVAFSEAALYRDYLVVFKKSKSSEPMTLVILKKTLNEIDPDTLSNEIKGFVKGPSDKISTDTFEAIKIHGTSSFLEKHVSNLKPLVGFNTIKGQMLFLELIDALMGNPTLREIENMGIVEMRYYNPGQYVKDARGSEREARLLFATRYLAGGECIFRIQDENEQFIKFEVKRVGDVFDIPRKDTITSLRTYSGVKHFDITNEEEYAIIEPRKIPNRIRNLVGLVNTENLAKAAKDIHKAFSELAGNVLLVRKLQIPSPNVYWIAYYSSNKILGTTDRINIKTKDDSISKLLTLYLNSSISLLQILGFHVETRGAWIRIDKDGVWSEVHVPNFNALSNAVKKKALEIFNAIGKAEVKPLFDRIREKSKIQRIIDEISLEMLGLDDWKTKLDDIYLAIMNELTSMLEILRTSKKVSKTKQKVTEKDEKRQLPLDGYF
ncbi:MAG: N-6 DNA methylase [Nitrososphaerota archaeon]